jgi:hypothetical protein
MTEDLSATPRRLETLARVRDGRVSYDSLSASYLVDGESVAGWDWRTLSELRDAGWLEHAPGTGVVPVRLTSQGEGILAEQES